MVAGPEAPLVALLKRDWNRPTAKDWGDVLATLPLFAGVARRHLRKIAELAEVREFDAGEQVVKAGDEADGFYLILEGGAKVIDQPRARAMRVGDYFGEMALLDGEPRSATVAAVGNLRTMRLPRKPFMRLLKQEPSIAMAMLTELAGRIRRLQKPTPA